MTFYPYAEHNGTVYDVDLDAPPSERWTAAAEAYGARVERLVENLRAEIEEYRGGWKKWVVDIGSTAIGAMTRILSGERGQEIVSIAEVAGMDPSELLTANLAYEITAHLEKFGLCSSASYVSRSGHPVLVRTLDWDSPASIGEHTVRIRFHRKNHHYDAISVAGFVGILSAQRPGAWAMTLNMASSADVTLWQVFQRPVSFHLRDCADAALTYRQLVDTIQTQQTGAAFFAHVVGVAPHERTVITGLGDHYEADTPADGEPLIVTNHFLDTEGVSADPEEPVLEDSFQRFVALQRRLARTPSARLRDAMKLLGGSVITNAHTQQKMVLCPSAKRLELQVRPCRHWAVEEVVVICPWCQTNNIGIVGGDGEYVCPHCGEIIVVG
jgi:hypothetical protein